MSDPRIEVIVERSGVQRARAEAAVARIDAHPDLRTALDAWVAGGAVDPQLISLGFTFRQLVEEYQYSELRAIDLLAQLRVDPNAVNFLTSRVDRVRPRTRHSDAGPGRRSTDPE